MKLRSQLCINNCEPLYEGEKGLRPLAEGTVDGKKFILALGVDRLLIEYEGGRRVNVLFRDLVWEFLHE